MIKLRNILIENKICKYTIFCDMDGVLSDFDTQFSKFNVGTKRGFAKKTSNENAWELIHSSGESFWSEMPWMPDGKVLWKYIEPYEPEILTAPSKQIKNNKIIYNRSCVAGKVKWVRNNLGHDVKINIEWPEEKRKHASEYAILIDDKYDNINGWIDAGGIGIYHTSAKDTIYQLGEYIWHQ